MTNPPPTFDAIIHGVNPGTPYPRRATIHAHKPPNKRGLKAIGVSLIISAATLALWQAWLLWGTTWRVAPAVTARVETFHSTTPPTPPWQLEPTKHKDAPPTMPTPQYGETFAILHVPSWNHMALPVTEGTDAAILDTGDAGHYELTSMPGEIGNFALAGHRQTYGHNFRDVHKLEAGDPLIVETPDAYLIYRVTSTEIVDPTDTSVIWPTPHQQDTPPTTRLMTLTTCHPEYGNKERFIVYTTLDYWTKRSEGIPGELK